MINDLEIAAQFVEDRRVRKEQLKAEFEARKAEREAEKSEALASESEPVIYPVKIVNGEVVLPDDEEFTEDDEHDDPEAALTAALMLLQDCMNVLTVLSDHKVVVLSRYLQQEAQETLVEVGAFLAAYDMEELNNIEKAQYIDAPKYEPDF